ncbi:LysR family transcriptional regulator [Alkalimarinus coralli]|uniref:LysR family transcriptional regulator n=1 Tax=Alkalimarinus coralli TaxID=2935863 RepID=UPI00202B8668|nr:LysR family transcriptional regulator [Alkalimarinus coralli]
MPLTVQKLVNRLTFRQLQVFLSVYQSKSYSKAGDILGLTQPAVSSQVRQLESAIGVPVFEYVGRQLYCTPAGEKLASSIHVMFDELRYLQTDLAALEGHVAGDLNLVAVNTAQYVVPYLLKSFLDIHPAVNINLSVVNRAEAIQRLSQNKDHFVVMGIVPEEKPLTSIPFLDNEFLPVTNPHHELLKTNNPSISDFLERDLLIREKGSGSRLALELYCHQNRLDLKPKMELGSNDAIKHAVIAGLGVAILPKHSILPELKLGQLKVVPIDDFRLKRSWCVVYQKAKHQTPAMNAFLEFVMENLSNFKSMINVDAEQIADYPNHNLKDSST